MGLVSFIVSLVWESKVHEHFFKAIQQPCIYSSNPLCFLWDLSEKGSHKINIRKGCSLKDTQFLTFWNEPDIGFSYRQFWAKWTTH